MKILLQIFMVIALIMAGFNLFQIDWELPFEGKSMVAVIGVVASLSAFLLLLILRISKKYQRKSKINSEYQTI